MISLYPYVYVDAPAPSLPSLLGLCNVFFYVQSFMHESIVLSFVRPACIAHIVAIRLHGYWAIYDSPSNLRFVRHTPYNIGYDKIL